MTFRRATFHLIGFCFLVLLLLSPLPSMATFSIIACEDNTGICGAAVATNNLAVGSSVPHVKANTGALVSQYETHPGHGPWGLDLLAEKQTPERVLKQLLDQDDNFEGGSIADRQIAIVGADGKIASWTGKNTVRSPWAGQLQSHGVSVQGNGLKSEAVLKEMLETFNREEGALVSRLMKALEAGQMAGGQSNGNMSAALMVRTPEGFPFDIDLRVDSHEAPVVQLRHLLNLHQARQLIIDARRFANTEPEKARALMAEALEKGKTWDRILVSAVQVATRLQDVNLAAQLKDQLNHLNPAMYEQVYGSSDSWSK